MVATPSILLKTYTAGFQQKQLSFSVLFYPENAILTFLSRQISHFQCVVPFTLYLLSLLDEFGHKLVPSDQNQVGYRFGL